jgi:hypothetical protein
MAKTKKYNSFREFYEDEDRPRKKVKQVSESQKKKDKMKKQFKFLDPKNIREEDFDEFEDYQ